MRARQCSTVLSALQTRHMWMCATYIDGRCCLLVERLHGRGHHPGWGDAPAHKIFQHPQVRRQHQARGGPTNPCDAFQMQHVVSAGECGSECCGGGDIQESAGGEEQRPVDAHRGGGSFLGARRRSCRLRRSTLHIQTAGCSTTRCYIGATTWRYIGRNKRQVARTL